jgi:acetyl-CoA acetyltransferase
MAREIGIVGYGQTPYLKRANQPLIAYLGEATRRALASAGLRRADVDGLAVGAFQLPPDNAVTLAEQFGITVSFAWYFTAGGAGSVSAVMAAMRAIEAGQADVVVCVAGDCYDVGAHYRLMGNFNQALSNYALPHGFGGPNGLFALVTRKHMERYGTTREQFGRICVGQRASAVLNDNAMLRTPMTMDDYLNARMIADPLRLYDCVLPCAGAEAVVVAALDRVPKEKRVRVLATREQHNHPPGEVAPLHIGAQLFRDRLYADAGVGPADMQFVQAYDDYPVMVAIQLEDLGYFTAGEAPSFLAKHSFAWNGSFPLNTGGGQLSCGQTGAGGGMIGLWEAVAQLRHEAGARQIKGVKRGLVSGYGMVGYGHGLGSAAIILERAA